VSRIATGVAILSVIGVAGCVSDVDPVSAPDAAASVADAPAASDGARSRTADTAADTPAPEVVVCTPACEGKACGPDGCGDVCGQCPAVAPVCTPAGLCDVACTPICEGKKCGDDGCGDVCGQCPAVAPVCTSDGLCDVDTTGGGGTTDGACELIEPEHGGAEIGPECDTAGCPCGVVIDTVTGIVQDDKGAPVDGAKAQLCARSARDGGTVCLAPVDTAANGSFTLSVPADHNCMYESVMRALVPNQSYSTAYCTISGDALTATGGTMDLSSTPIILRATTAATTAPDNDAYDWGVPYTVVFDDGLEIDITADWFFNGAVGIKSIAATYIDGTDHLCNGAAIVGAPGTWAISPEGDALLTRFPARIPDKLGLADGTAVNLYIQGGIGHTIQIGDEKTDVFIGAWHHFACATVEGGVITLEGEDGIPALGWLSYAPVAE